MLVFLFGCSDYDVAHSKLIAEVESPEVELVEGTSTDVTLRLEADREALDAGPSSFLDLSVFGARTGGAPIVEMQTGSQTDELDIATTGFLEATVDDPFGACTGTDAMEFEAEDSGAGCVVWVPVHLAVSAGEVSLGVTAHAELNFPREEAPGTLTITVE